MVSANTMFESKKSTIRFAVLSNRMNMQHGVEAKEKFTQYVKELFDQKITSEEGEYDSFKITEKDLDVVYKKVSLTLSF